MAPEHIPELLWPVRDSSGSSEAQAENPQTAQKPLGHHLLLVRCGSRPDALIYLLVFILKLQFVSKQAG